MDELISLSGLANVADNCVCKLGDICRTSGCIMEIHIMIMIFITLLQATHFYYIFVGIRKLINFFLLLRSSKKKLLAHLLM